MAQKAKHPGSIRRRGNSWQFVVWSPVDKKARTFTLGVVTEDEARELAQAKYDEIQNEIARAGDGLAIRTRVSDLIRLFRRDKLATVNAANTRRAYAGSLDRFDEYFVRKMGDPFIEKVRPVHVQGFLSWRRENLRSGRAKGAKTVKRLASNRTLAKDRAVLHRLFDYAERMELRERNPVALVEPEKSDSRKPVILSDDQYDALVAACADSPMLRLYVLALGETGGRCESEILWLRWEDVDLEDGFLTIVSGRGEEGGEIHRTKSGKSRPVPMTPRLRAAMRDHFARYRLAAYAGKRSPWIFHHEFARRHAKPGERIGSLRRGFQGAAKRAGLPADLHQHDLRHRRVVEWLSAGKPIHVVRDAMGHSTVKVTEGYDSFVKERLRQLVDEDDKPVRAAGSGA